MILADKIIEERKKLGISQEELADKISVSRQAVSKWESAQSIPDIDKIITLSRLFSVSTDYLLKDELEPDKSITVDNDYDRSLHVVNIEEANDYMNIMNSESKNVAIGVSLCVSCPVLLIFLNGLAVGNFAGITETIACTIGIIVLFIFIATAVYLFVRYSGRMEQYQHLEKEEFETAYGVLGLVKEKKSAFEPTYSKLLSIGIILCILSPLPLIISVLIKDNDVIVTSMTSLLLVVVAIGVYMIVRVALIKSSFQVLLQEEGYNKKEKRQNKATEKASGFYWCLITGVYLTWSFISGDWKTTWIVWPIAGAMFAPYSMLIKLIFKSKDN